MQLSSRNRDLLLKGLRLSIRAKEREITKVRQKTEEDYVILSKFSTTSLEDWIQDDIQSIKKEITELQALYDSINNLRNQILFVPDTIKLHLHSKEK